MNKILMTTLAFTFAAVGVFAEGKAPVAGEQSAAERKAKLRAQRERVRRYRGDILAKPGSKKGSIRVVLSASGVSPDAIKLQNTTYLGRYSYDLDVVQGEAVSVDTALKAKNGLGANIAVFVVESKGSAPMLVAPEEGWAIVNATACGSPSRTEKEVVRALAYVCGAATSDYGLGCMSVMKPSELDMVRVLDMPFDVVQRSEKHLKFLGVTPETRSNYRTACSEGWAPPPTNDIQRAIWDEIHKLPTNPLPLVKPTK